MKPGGPRSVRGSQTPAGAPRISRTSEISARARREASTWSDLARASLLQADWSEALWCLRRSVELDPDDPVTWRLLGRCFEEIGSNRRAERCFRLAARLEMAPGRHQSPEGPDPLTLFWELREPRDV